MSWTKSPLADIAEEEALQPQATNITVTPLAPGDEDEWNRFVIASPSGTYFHLYGWNTVVQTVLGHRCIYLVARRGGRITGVFPLSLVRSRVFGTALISLPLAVYGGVCADDEASFRELQRAGIRLAQQMNVHYLEMRNRADLYATTLPGRDLYVSFRQTLSSGPDLLMQGLPRDTRYMIRKSMKAGLEWTEDLSLDEFYELYARTVHRLGTPVFSKRLFRALKDVFSESVRVFGVRKGKRAIAGVMCFYFRNEVMPYYAGCLAEHYRDCPNNFLYWHLILQSCRDGFTSFDFGRSKRGTGSFAFKASWSMPAVPLAYRYQLVRAEEVPQMSPIDGRFQFAVSAWKRLPLGITKVLGPTLIRAIPSV